MITIYVICVVPYLTFTYAAGLGFVPLIAGCSLAELRALVLNTSRVAAFVGELVEDAVRND